MFKRLAGQCCGLDDVIAWKLNPLALNCMPVVRKWRAVTDDN
ncbi:MAG: hypothetical protein O3A01_00250 [bacterium]|nr:hypothetical protein [bacterium]